MKRGELGRREPGDWRHVERYGLADAPPSEPVPVVLGINWYDSFFYPQQDTTGEYWIGRGADPGRRAGGHAICAKPVRSPDLWRWWRWYQQGLTSGCCGFSASRMMSHLNSRVYSGPWLYWRARLIDEWPGEKDDGTSVRATCEVLRTKGAKPRRQPASLEDGIAAYRWATSWDEVRATLGIPADRAGVPLLNSWGRQYPHIVRLDDAMGARLLAENGEAAVPTDR